MIKRWIKYRWRRSLVKMRSKSIEIFRMLETSETSKMDQIQSLVYTICLKLIHDSNSELRSNTIDYTYHIENDDYLIMIRPNSGHYSITLIEYRTRELINNFDVPFDMSHIKVIIDSFEREIHKRMKSKQLLKTTKVAKHLQRILDQIDISPIS